MEAHRVTECGILSMRFRKKLEDTGVRFGEARKPKFQTTGSSLLKYRFVIRSKYECIRNFLDDNQWFTYSLCQLQTISRHPTHQIKPFFMLTGKYTFPVSHLIKPCCTSPLSFDTWEGNFQKYLSYTPRGYEL